MQLLMHNQDQDMLLIKPGDDKTIFKMDVERGQVVDEWVCLHTVFRFCLSQRHAEANVTWGKEMLLSKAVKFAFPQS